MSKTDLERKAKILKDPCPDPSCVSDDAVSTWLDETKVCRLADALAELDLIAATEEAHTASVNKLLLRVEELEQQNAVLERGFKASLNQMSAIATVIVGDPDLPLPNDMADDVSMIRAALAQLDAPAEPTFTEKLAAAQKSTPPEFGKILSEHFDEAYEATEPVEEFGPELEAAIEEQVLADLGNDDEHETLDEPAEVKDE